MFFGLQTLFSFFAGLFFGQTADAEPQTSTSTLSNDVRQAETPETNFTSTVGGGEDDAEDDDVDALDDEEDDDLDDEEDDEEDDGDEDEDEEEEDDEDNDDDEDDDDDDDDATDIAVVQNMLTDDELADLDDLDAINPLAYGDDFGELPGGAGETGVDGSFDDGLI